MKTYPEFLAVISNKIDLYEQIPEGHLSVTGNNVFDLYKAVFFNTGFASNATELLELVMEDEDVANFARFAGVEYRKIRRCLERLAATENVPAN